MQEIRLEQLAVVVEWAKESGGGLPRVACQLATARLWAGIPGILRLG